MSNITEFVKGHTIKDIYYAQSGNQNLLIIEFDSEQEENPCIKIPVQTDGSGRLGTPFLEAFPINIELHQVRG